MKVNLITGGAGFIAVELTRRLLARGDIVVSVDNLSRGRQEFLQQFLDNNRFTFAVADCADYSELREAVRICAGAGSITDVWHLAANSDIPAGIQDPGVDLKDTFLTTFNVLRLMKDVGAEALHFASSSAVYGDLGGIPVHEDIGPLNPISNYGAMKLASEAQIRAAVESYLPRADIFRFPNVIGIPATHGVIFDFINKLKSSAGELSVLGDGTQKKPYLHVEDLVEAMLFIASKASDRHNVFNIGPQDEGITVREIAEAVCSRVAPSASLQFGKEGRGWVGDVPRFCYSTDRLAGLGWTPTLSSQGAVSRAVDQIATQLGV